MAISLGGLALLPLYLLFIKVHRDIKSKLVIPNKEIEEMNAEEVRAVLLLTQFNNLRWVEDLIEVLIAKKLITLEDLPLEARKKIEYKKKLRNRMLELKGDE